MIRNGANKMSEQYFIIEQHFPFKGYVGKEAKGNGVSIVDSIKDAKIFMEYQDIMDFIVENEWEEHLEKKYIEIVPCI